VDALFDHLDFARDDNFFVKVFYQCLDKWSADSFNALFEPNVIVKEFSLSSKDTEFDGKVIVAAVYYFDEAVFDLLGDVEDPRQIEDFVVWCAKLTDAADHQLLVEVPEFLEHRDRVDVQAEEHRHEDCEELVDKQTTLGDVALA
jgi:hypothetical protein